METVDAIDDKFADQHAEPKLSNRGAARSTVKGDHGQHATVQF
jgi:hypothetical protein